MLDRAGIRPIDKPEPEQKQSDRRLDPSKYTLEELEQIEAALVLMAEGPRREPAADEEGA